MLPLWQFFDELKPSYEFIRPKVLRPLTVSEIQQWAQLSIGEPLCKDLVVAVRKLCAEYRNAVMHRSETDNFRPVEKDDVEGIAQLFRSRGARTPEDRAAEKPKRSGRGIAPLDRPGRRL